MEIEELNRAAWDRAAAAGNPHTQPVSPEQVAEARAGRFTIFFTDHKPVPAEWLGDLRNCRVLGLAAGGGQQGPLLAAAGATVTVLDISDEQLARDRFVADRDGLNLRLVQGRMDDLSAFGDGVFDLIVNPPSTLFVPDLAPIWRECHRVLRRGGHLVTAFANPDEFVFDPDILDDTGQFVMRNRLPWAEADALTPEQRRQRILDGEMLHFSHSMEAQLGGLCVAGFVLTGFYEDRRSEADGNPIRLYMPSGFVVRARRE
ncbi:MAG TPA: class I SAM-dependent methyltransferase [Microlunatus sp.]|nr:class I SAM-dependent methyltransferase [Microlunatus sp.]